MPLPKGTESPVVSISYPAVAGRLWAVSGLSPHGRGPGCGHLPIASHQPHHGGTTMSGGSMSPVPPLPVPGAAPRQRGNAISCSCGISRATTCRSGLWARGSTCQSPAALSHQSCGHGSRSCKLGVCPLCGACVASPVTPELAELRGHQHRVLCHGGAWGGPRTTLWHVCSAATPPT